MTRDGAMLTRHSARKRTRSRQACWLVHLTVNGQTTSYRHASPVAAYPSEGRRRSDRVVTVSVRVPMARATDFKRDSD